MEKPIRHLEVIYIIENDEHQGNFKDLIEFRIDSGDVTKRTYRNSRQKYDISLENYAKSIY